MSNEREAFEAYLNTWGKVCDLLSAPVVEVAGQSQEGIYVEQVEPLCSLPKAQAIIDQQAARIKELEREISYLMGQINGE